MAFSRAAAAQAKKAEDERILDVHMEVLEPGDAINFPQSGDSLSVHYIGYLEDGTCFDNSYNRGMPIHFELGTGVVLKGWEIAVRQMSKGTKARITLHPNIAYGEKGYPPIIPPMATLIFEIHLLSLSRLKMPEKYDRER